MKIKDFKLERFCAKHEFTAKYLLSASDCESLKVTELLQMADPESLQLWHDLKLGYTETKGHTLLRQEISKLYKETNPEDVLVLAPGEGIFVAFNTILKHGDHVIVTAPSYQSLYEVPKAIGCDVTKWFIYPEDNRWNIDLNFLQESIKKNTKLIIINFPHNPTGYIPAVNELKSLIEIAGKNDIYVFSDEMYNYLEFSKSHSIEPVGNIYRGGISLSGLSKSFGLPGLRIGWLTTRNKALMKQFERFKDYTTICNSALSEILGIIALREKDEIIGKNLNLIRENISIAKDYFTKHKNLLSWIESQGSSVAFPKLSERFQVDEFCKDLIEQKSIMLLPGSIFNYSGNHFRIGLGRKNFKRVLEEFDPFLNEYR